MLIISTNFYSCSNTENNDTAVDLMRTYEPKTYIVYKTDDPITVDGITDEEIWNSSEWTDDFINLAGDLSISPEYRTKVKLLYDDNYLYVAGEMEESDIYGTMTERNSRLYLDNALEVFIDPDGDTHNYAEFQINALSTIWDLLLTKPYRDGGRGISQWNLLDYQSAVYLDGDINNPESEDRKWTTEIALPLAAISEINSGKRTIESGVQWKVNFSRAQRRLDVADGSYKLRINPDTDRPFDPDFYVWSPQGVNNIHIPEMWGIMQFSEKIAGQGKDDFIWNRNEELKWALRQVYYRIHDYYREHGEFTDSPELLNIVEITVDDYNFDPKIMITETMFEVSTPGFDGETTWYISEDGKVWNE
ncbi:carbohydrate-binding family 9-like protein [Rhodohalobacter sp. 8-1]|uniref:carbohydrate-binding family 9-like protein n=1 Tax=Rhodohalobacter sp. 8-1 TaxID=3131972 RepID=UPI0030EE14AF